LSKWEDLIPQPRSRFLRVKCPDCGNEQVVFGSASIPVHCNVCGASLAEPKGGKTRVRGEIVGVLE